MVQLVKLTADEEVFRIFTGKIRYNWVSPGTTGNDWVQPTYNSSKRYKTIIK